MRHPLGGREIGQENRIIQSRADLTDAAAKILLDLPVHNDRRGEITRRRHAMPHGVVEGKFSSTLNEDMIEGRGGDLNIFSAIGTGNVVGGINAQDRIHVS